MARAAQGVGEVLLGLEIHPGARATEARLLAVLRELRDAARGDPTLLAQPVRVIVPSRSLRLHASERAASDLGALAGLAVQTLYGAALEILDRAGEAQAGADLLVETLARRFAREEPALAEAFEDFRDGYRTVAGSVRDLLDAGFEPELLEAALERLAEARLERDELARAAAVLRTAARVALHFERSGEAGDGATRAREHREHAAAQEHREHAEDRAGKRDGERAFGGRSALLARAAEIVLRDGERALPARLLVVHGFADATGRATDLLEALVRKLPALVLVDHPSDPSDLTRPDLGCAFTERLVERVAGVLGAPRVAPREPPASVAATEPVSSTSDRRDLPHGLAHAAARELPQAVPQLAAEQRSTHGAPAGCVHLSRAPGPEAEARSVARAIRALLASGVRPERIGVVARDLASYAVPLRRSFARLGVPASALRARAPIDGAGRAVLALLDVLEQKERAPSDRWLDATRRLRVERDGAEELRSATPGLRLGLRVAGAARLADAAELDPALHLDDKDLMKLPVRTGVSSGEEAADEEREPPLAAGMERAPQSSRVSSSAPNANRPSIGFHARRARIHGSELRGAVRAAGSVLRRLARWPQSATLARHLTELERLRRDDLGWRLGRGDSAERRVRAALARAADGFGDEQLTAAEFAHLARRALAPAAAPAFAVTGDIDAMAEDGARSARNAGGGVRVLEAMEARALTFEHLFVLGLNRDVFPRVVREDPLLGDGARRALQEVLPDVPLPARGRDEDRYLFAQLLSASNDVALSWQLSDDDGKPRVVSPLVERLLGTRGADEVEAVPPIFPPRLEEARAGGPRNAHEHAVVGGLFRGRSEIEARTELALREVNGAQDPELVARVRGRVLAAHDRGPFEPELLAPWLGFLGSQEEAGVRPDPRTESLYVTRFEGLARCPWQTVLGKLLKLEHMPDPLDALPGIEPMLIGNVAHRVIESVAQRSLGSAARYGSAMESALGSGREGQSFARDADPAATFAAVLASPGSPLHWPEGDELWHLILSTARDVIAEERPPVPGLVRMIAECARPHVERARAFDLEEARRFGELLVLGAEVVGSARVASASGAPLELLFRADRIERRGGAVVLTDFKTGKPVSLKNWKKEIPRGTGLQPLVYALAASAAGVEARGRFLFLAADGEKEEVEVALAEKHAEHLPEFERALGALVDAWLAGTFFPRLADETGEKAPDRCRFCEVSQACLRGDSGARRALVKLARGESALASGGAELSALWSLAAVAKGEHE